MPPSSGAFGRGCALVPQTLFGGEDCLSEALVLSNAKELTINNRMPTKSRFLVSLGMTTERHLPLGATPGRQWFWVLLPKQKDLVVRGRNPA